MTPLDSNWIAANPVPVHGSGTTKNSRGRVLAIGGAASVPGALRLTGEAALRAGAGKLQLATIAPAALLLGVAVPEAGVIALPEEDGEIGDCDDALARPLASCDALVAGPGMGEPGAAGRLLAHILAAVGDDTRIVIDATAIPELKDCRSLVGRCADRIVITPHHGEMAALTGEEPDAIAADPERAALAVAREYGITVVLKAEDTVIAASDGTVLHYIGGGIGLATAGSGDVLAGAIAGLLSRGASPLVAAGWGVWLHGHGGRRVAAGRGPIGFLARELPQEFPRLLPQ